MRANKKWAISMRIEIHFRWSMSKTLFTKMTVWATEAANEHLICTKQKKSWNNANEMNKCCHFNPCHFVPLYFFHFFNIFLKRIIFSFRFFFQFVPKKIINRFFHCYDNYVRFNIHPHLSAMCQILHFRIWMFFF